jgi:hypothetical protein
MSLGNHPNTLSGGTGSVTGSGLSPVGTAGITAGQVAYGDTVANTIKGEAAFAYNDSTNTLTVGAIDLTTALPAADGGTGQSSYTVGDLLYASGATALSKLAASTTNFVLTAQGVGAAPIWAPVSGAGLGDFSGPGPTVTDGEIVRFDGTGGLTGQASGIAIADVAATNITVSTIGANNLTFSALSGASLTLGQGASGAGTLTVNPASTNTIVSVLTLSRSTSGAAAAGIGGRLNFQAEDDAGNLRDGGAITTIAENVAAATPAFALGFEVRNTGGQYAAGRFTSTGNLLIGGTTDISGGGGLKVFGTTAATSTTSGALQVAGGVGVAGAVYVGTNLVTTGAVVAVTTARSGAGAVSATSLTTTLTSTGVAEAITLADGVNGQIKTIAHDVDGGSMVLTPTTKTGWSTATFTNAGDTLTLQFFTTRGWMVLASYGTVVAP